MHAIRKIARPGFEEWLGDAQVNLHEKKGKTQVLEVSKVYSGGSSTNYYWIEKGQVIGHSPSAASDNAMSSWFEIRGSKGDGLIEEEVERYLGQPNTKFPTTFRYKYQQIDGIWIPTTIYKKRIVNPAKQNLDLELTLSEIVIRGSAKLAIDGDGQGGAEKIPTGLLAEKARAAWNRGYRYPAEAATVSGNFVVTNSGKDQLWQGIKKVEGTFVLNEFRGTSWGDWELEAQWAILRYDEAVT